MEELFATNHGTVLDPATLVGAVLYAAVFVAAALLLAMLVRRGARRIGSHLTDVTGLRFLSALAQALVYLLAFILYAHLIPGLHALGTALLAGVSVISIVIGLAAQNTLGNLVAGFALVLYRPFRIGDRVQLATPRGLTTATVELISLGYTRLRDENGDEVVVPNAVMASNVVILLSGASPVQG
jgi:moderate conductance mechanosensitive channel